MDAHSTPLRIYTIPFSACSHLLSLFEVSLLFAVRGQHVTILATPTTAGLFQKSIDKANASGHHLRVHYLKFPSEQVGLPDGVETLTSVDDPDTTAKVFAGTMLLRQQMEQFMEQNPPDCIISDMFYPWTADFAIRMGIPRLYFDGSGAFQFCLKESLRRSDSPHRKPNTSQSDTFLMPGLPHPITMTLCQLPDNDESDSMMESFRESELKSYGRLVNGFSEIEEDYKGHYQKTTNCKVWHVGPTSLLNRTSEEKAERNVKTVVSEREYLTWLNSKQPNSVLYICFGSSWLFPDNQLYEIASGLESSGCQFIWVIRRKDNVDDQSEENREKWLPKGFVERVLKRENRGMIVSGWVPQTLILDHLAIGGFVTHCGWNSVKEAICAGVPMITWPLAAEQFYNEKLITQVHEIGVEVGAEEWTFAPWSERKKLVTRDRIHRAVRKLMNGGDEAMGMRRRVQDLQHKAKTAMEEGGSSQRNLTALIQDLQRLRSIRTPTSQD